MKKADNSFLQLGQDEMEVEVPSAKRKYIICASRVDAFSTLRTRKLLTPSMCTKPGCGFDAAQQIGGDWDSLSSEQRVIAAKVLREHTEVLHNRSEDYIVEEDLMPTNWLGGDPRKGAFRDI